MAADGRTSGAGHGAKTAAAREQAILALLSEPTIGQAAARCHMGERTLRRWLTEDQAFQAEYEAARHATFQAALRRIPALTMRAIDTLENLLDAATQPAVRLGAARTVAEESGCINTTGRRFCGSWMRSKRVNGGGEICTGCHWDRFAPASSAWRGHPGSCVMVRTS